MEQETIDTIKQYFNNGVRTLSHIHDMYPDGDDYKVIRIAHTMSTAKFMDEYNIDKDKVYETKCINKTIAN